MKLLYDRVHIAKEKPEEYEGTGIIKHTMSNDHRIEDISYGIIKHVGVECQEVKVGDRVAWPAKQDRFIEVEPGEKLVELRESLILGIVG